MTEIEQLEEYSHHKSGYSVDALQWKKMSPQNSEEQKKHEELFHLLQTQTETDQSTLNISGHIHVSEALQSHAKSPGLTHNR